MPLCRLCLLGCLAVATAVLRADVPPALAARPAPAPAAGPDVKTPAAPAAPGPIPPAPPVRPEPDRTAAPTHAADLVPPSAAATPAESPGAPPLPEAVVAKATARLKELVARQDALLAALGHEGADLDNVKRDIQTLIFDYDDFLRTYPTFAPGYVTYGILLGKVGMRRESSRILLRANQLDPNQPLVKNQLGNYLAEEGEPVEAANYYIAATRLAPEEPLYHDQLGRLLALAREDFVKSGLWTRQQIDETMLAAFKRAAELAPDNMTYAYHYGMSYYELAEPRWDEALKVWGAIEQRSAPGVEQDSARLQAANILIQQKQFDHARLLLAAVTTAELAKSKQKLLDQLPANPEK